MKETLIFVLAQVAYSVFLRDLVKNAIDDPNSEVDEKVLNAIDTLLGYRK